MGTQIKKMVETTRIRVAVVESQYVSLGDLGIPLSFDAFANATTRFTST